MVIRPIVPAEESALSSLKGLSGVDETSATASSPIDSFGSVLGSALSEANHLDFAASQKVEALAAGTIDDLHGTMIATKEADIAIKLVGTVRSKILDAFQELWRTSV
ncbi:MAG: flagellar hook-basal body complex protein FliE [Polyangiaceae bacterium]|jgi:flagellar hook-basal body complex protein FliE